MDLRKRRARSDAVEKNCIIPGPLPKIGVKKAMLAVSKGSRNTVELYKDKLDLKLINNKEAILVENNNFTIIK